MAKEIEIVVEPLSKKRIDKWEIFKKITKGEYFKNAERPTISEKIKLCSDYCDLPEDTLREAKAEHIDKVFSQVVENLGHFPRSPKREIEILGKKYSFVRRFSDMSGAWHEKVRITDFLKDPIQMAALCYIEKGMKYATKGEHDIIVNPTDKRAELFELHFPLDLYLDLNNFFLQKLSDYAPVSVRMQEARKMIAAEKTAEMKHKARKASRPI